tara:strand:+ start:1217 stop:2449 length:1233 start_codon:yes stop_codon:yes gene_type:complete
MTFESLWRRKAEIAFFSLYTVATAYIALNLLHDYSIGGHDWKQADWLINNEGGLVRRGLIGSFLIGLSRFSSLDLLALTIGLQLILLLLVVGVTVLAAVRVGLSERLVLLLMSPGFFVFFWAGDPSASMRKEVFVFGAFAILALDASNRMRSVTLLFLSILLFCIGIAAHEGMIFFLPAFMIALHCCLDEKVDKFYFTLMVTAAVFSIVFFLINLTFATIDDSLLVCQPLLERGFSPRICDGAISSLTRDLGDELDRTSQLFYSFAPLKLAISVGLVALPIGVFFHDAAGLKIRVIALVMLVAIISFLPLYFMAIDWGRWLNFQCTVVTFLALILSAKGVLVEAKTPLSSSVFVAMLLFVILFGFKIADANPLHGGLLFEIVMNDFEPVSLGEFVDNERFVAGHPTKWGM